MAFVELHCNGLKATLKIESNLFNTTTYVSSSVNTITCGVPQGSILGPLFFIFYINDLPNALNITESLLFADDTSIYYSHSDTTSLINVLNDELRNIDRSMKANKLSV